jgi:hypothetical protein
MGLDGGWAQQPEGFFDCVADFFVGVVVALFFFAVGGAPYGLLFLLSWLCQ